MKSHVNLPQGTPKPLCTGGESSDDEINLADLGRVIWAGRWPILAASLISALIALAAATYLPKKYDAKILLSPVSEDSQSQRGMGSGNSAISSQLGGLASLAGLSNAQGGFKAEAMATLQSEIVTEHFVQENNLLQTLFSKQWDLRQEKWKSNDPEEIPTLWKANQLFVKKIRTVSDNPKTGLALMTITWKDPKIAASWANGLVKMTNLYLRDKAIVESERRIAYLKSQVAATNVVELQQAIYSLMENEINKEMLARGTDEYALKVVDPASIPEEASWPKRVLWVAIAFFGAMVFALGVVLARGALKPIGQPT